MTGKLYTVAARCASPSAKTGACAVTLHLTREITSGSLELHHHDPATGHAYLTLYTTGEAVRVPANHLTPWN